MKKAAAAGAGSMLSTFISPSLSFSFVFCAYFRVYFFSNWKSDAAANELITFDTKSNSNYSSSSSSSSLTSKRRNERGREIDTV